VLASLSFTILLYVPTSPDRKDRNWVERSFDWFAYWFLRCMHWVFSLRTPLLTFFDTFINLIQGKNETIMRAFADTIIDEQRNMVRVAHAIRRQVHNVILKTLQNPEDPNAPSRGLPVTVRRAARVNFASTLASRLCHFAVLATVTACFRTSSLSVAGRCGATLALTCRYVRPNIADRWAAHDWQDCFPLPHRREIRWRWDGSRLSCRRPKAGQKRRP